MKRLHVFHDQVQPTRALRRARYGMRIVFEATVPLRRQPDETSHLFLSRGQKSPRATPGKGEVAAHFHGDDGHLGLISAQPPGVCRRPWAHRPRETGAPGRLLAFEEPWQDVNHPFLGKSFFRTRTATVDRPRKGGSGTPWVILDVKRLSTPHGKCTRPGRNSHRRRGRSSRSGFPGVGKDEQFQSGPTSSPDWWPYRVSFFWNRRTVGQGLCCFSSF